MTAVPAPAAGTSWSPPAAAGPCPAGGPPWVLFPQDGPSEPTGPGALVWQAAPGCPGGPGARVDQIAQGAAPGAPARPRSASGALIAPLGPLSAASSPHGQIAILGADPRHPGGALLVQGHAGGPFRALLKGGPLLPGATLSTAYLGDLALLAPTRASAQGALGLSVERWFGNALGPTVDSGGPAAGAVSGLTVALDFRSDAIVAWAQDGAVWVRDVPAHGGPRPARRLGPAGPAAHIVALLSDDNRGIVMWSERSGAATNVWMDYSATGPRFGAPRLLEHIVDPSALQAPAGSPQLIRLSSESVMAAWAGAEGGRWVVRTAPVDQHGLRTVGTIAAPGGDALLCSLAPGPHGEAIALFGQPRQGPVAAEEALYSARGFETDGRTVFGAPEAIAGPGPVSGATVAIEPGSDRAIAAWQGSEGAVYYSLRAPEPAG